MNKYLELFVSFFKIGLFTFGGGYAMIVMFGDEVTKRRGWCSQEEFLEYLSLAQSSPGPMAINTSILIGYHVKGWKGGLVAFLGSALPSFIILLTVAMLFSHIGDNPTVISIFKGMRPCVVALILYPVFNFSKHVKRIEYPLIVAIAALIYLGISPVWAILGAIVWGVSRSIIVKKR